MQIRTLAFLRTKLLRCGALTLVALAIVAVYRLLLPVNQTTVVLTFLVLVLLVASRWQHFYSIYFSLLCALLYNFYFLPPLGRFTVADPQDLVALAAFLGAGLIVSYLARSEHRQMILSQQRSLEVERLYEFSQQLLLQDDLSELARNAPRLIASVFRLDAVALYMHGQDAAYYSDSSDEVVSLAELQNASESSEATPIAPADVRLLPLMLGLRPVGALAMRQGEYSDGIYSAIGGLVAIAVERASAVERFSRVEAAREGERLRTALLDSVAHELRTPLTAIRVAVTSLSSQTSLDEGERREMIAIVDEESARLDRLIGQAMEMAQLDSQGLTVRLLPERIGDVIGQALEDSRALLRDREVILDVPSDLPPIALDRELIRRVLRHLIENAAKYSPPGSSIRLQSRVSDNRLSVSVVDGGQGIDEADRAFIFEKFYRGRRQRHRVQGTGMGLAIARAMIRAHGGWLELGNGHDSKTGSIPRHENERGTGQQHEDERHEGQHQGATFTFWIPLDPLDQRDAKAARHGDGV